MHRRSFLQYLGGVGAVLHSAVLGPQSESSHLVDLMREGGGAMSQPNSPPNASLARSQINPRLRNGSWPAQWIGPSERTDAQAGVFHYRKRIRLDDSPASFVVHVSADNRYLLYVNGSEVARGPARGDVDHWRFETVDLAPHLDKGVNVVAAVVWNFGSHRPVAQISHRTAFLMQGDTGTEDIVNTDASWQVHRNAGHELLPVSRDEIGGWYFVVGPGEKIVGDRYPWGWERRSFDEGDWPNASELGRAVLAGHHHRRGVEEWQLVPRQIPPMEITNQRIPRLRRTDGVDVPEDFLTGGAELQVPPNSSVQLLLDQTHLTTAFPVVEVSGGAGSRIQLTYAESLFNEDGEKGHRNVVAGKQMIGFDDRFLPDGGQRRRFQSLWFRTFRYIEVKIQTGSQPLTIHDLYGRFRAYPFGEKASFQTDNDRLDSIWRVGWRTARLCAGETYFDCPYYEQLQYVGDTRIQALISLYVAGDDRLMRRAIRDFHHSRIPEGLTQSRYPSRDEQFIPPYSLFWVAMVYDYWWHWAGNDKFVRRFLTPIRGVLEWYFSHIDGTGMLGPMPWWNFVDHSFEDRGVPAGANEGHSSIISLQLVYVLERAARLAEAYGRSDAASTYRSIAKSVKRSVYDQCWVPDRKLVADTPDRTAFSEHANVMAILVDLVSEDRQRGLLERILGSDDLTPCTYYYRFYLHRTMQKAGRGDLFLANMEPWYTMLDRGLTTFAEKPDPTRSDCHAWSASPLYEFLATVCGIQPGKPGFQQIRVAPALHELSRVEAVVPHPDGEIELNMSRASGGGLRGWVDLPVGTRGELEWNGRTVALSPGRQQFSL